FIKTKETREWLLKKALEIPFFTEYTQPDASKKLMDEFKVDNDTVRQFFDDFMSKLPIARIDGKPLYQSYQNWCNDNGYKKPLAKQTFIKQVEG
ncbi:primase-like DNA-binding domain-containing protein, partial [Companilactobacillus alimentarius]